MSGPWFAVHADFMDGPWERKLYERWGWCGVILWFAFTAACKRSDVEGQVAYHSDEQLAAVLGVHGRELVDRDGKLFTLRDFFQWTGIRRRTRMHRRTWPAVVYVDWERHQRYRVYPRRAPTLPKAARNAADSASPMHDPARARDENRRSEGKATDRRSRRRTQPCRTPSEPMQNLDEKRMSEGESVDVALTNDVPDPGGTPLKGVPPPTGGGAPPVESRESSGAPAPSQGSGAPLAQGPFDAADPHGWRTALKPKAVP